MTDMQDEVFKTPVNKIRLFEHGISLLPEDIYL